MWKDILQHIPGTNIIVYHTDAPKAYTLLVNQQADELAYVYLLEDTPAAPATWLHTKMGHWGQWPMGDC